MKILMLFLFISTFFSQAQLVFEVNSPIDERGVFPCMAGSPSEWINSPNLYQDGNWFSDTLVLADDGILGSACTPLTNSLNGKFALFRRSGCTLEQALLNVQTAGAEGAIIIDTVDGRPLPFLTESVPSNITIPFVIISRGKGDSLAMQLAAGTNIITSFGDKTGVTSSDIGIYKECALWSRYGVFSLNSDYLPEDHFGTWVFNHGTSQADDLQVRLWFSTTVNAPSNDFDTISSPFSIAAGDSSFIAFNLPYVHNQSMVSQNDTLRYGYEVINSSPESDILDNSISNHVIVHDDYISTTYISEENFDLVDYFVEGDEITSLSNYFMHCVILPFGNQPEGSHLPCIRNALIPLSGISESYGEEHSLWISYVPTGNLHGIHSNSFMQSFLYTDSVNIQQDSLFSDFDAWWSTWDSPHSFNGDIALSIFVSKPVNLGFTSDMYHDEQIRQGYHPSYFKKNISDTISAVEVNAYLMPVVYFKRGPMNLPCYLSVNENDEQFDVQLSPNPVNSVATIGSSVGLKTIQLIDLKGHLILEMNPNGLLNVQLQIDFLESGCYLVRIENESGNQIIKRLLKE